LTIILLSVSARSCACGMLMGVCVCELWVGQQGLLPTSCFFSIHTTYIRSSTLIVNVIWA